MMTCRPVPWHAGYAAWGVTRATLDGHGCGKVG